MEKTKSGLLCAVRQMASVTLVLLLLCGFGFPLLLGGLSSLLFPAQSASSLLTVDGQAVGARYVGQEFTEDCFLKGRPSAYRYNTYLVGADGVSYRSDDSEFPGLGSGASNYAPSNPALHERVRNQMAEFLAANPGVKPEDIPADLLTESGSGLDPHISPAAALVQISAVARASGLSEERLSQIVAEHTTQKLFGVFGEETVNVLLVNLQIAADMNRAA